MVAEIQIASLLRTTLTPGRLLESFGGLVIPLSVDATGLLFRVVDDGFLFEAKVSAVQRS